jgi:hypothetical protein
MWSIKGQYRRESGSYSGNGTYAKPIEIEIICPKTREVHLPSKMDLREVLRTRIRMAIECCRKDKDLPAKCIIPLSADWLPYRTKAKTMPARHERNERMKEKWHLFDKRVVQLLYPKPGVYELVDKSGVPVYIGAANNMRSCFRKLLTEPKFHDIRRRSHGCRVDYRVDCMHEALLRRRIFRQVYDRDPFCHFLI